MLEDLRICGIMSDEKKQAKNLFKPITKNVNSVLHGEVSLTINLIEKVKHQTIKRWSICKTACKSQKQRDSKWKK